MIHLMYSWGSVLVGPALVNVFTAPTESCKLGSMPKPKPQTLLAAPYSVARLENPATDMVWKAKRFGVMG